MMTTDNFATADAVNKYFKYATRQNPAKLPINKSQNQVLAEAYGVTTGASHDFGFHKSLDLTPVPRPDTCYTNPAAFPARIP